MSKTRKKCGSCGSVNIEFHGYMFWDESDQRMYSSDYSDEAHCLDCGNDEYYVDSKIIEIPNNINVL
jgi:hypothetical protein